MFPVHMRAHLLSACSPVVTENAAMRQEGAERMIILEQLQISSIIDIQESSSVAGQDQRRCLGWIQVGASVRADVMFKVLPADESYTAVSAYRASINRIPRDLESWSLHHRNAMYMDEMSP